MSIKITPELKKKLKGKRLAQDVIREIRAARGLSRTTFGEALRGFREIQGYTQVELAKLLGISKQELCNIEKGRKIISLERSVSFAKALKLPSTVFASYILEDELYRAGIEGEVIIKSVA